MSFIRGMISRLANGSIATAVGTEIAKRAPGVVYTGIVGSVGGVAAVTATTITSDAKISEKIKKIKSTTPQAALYGGGAGLLFALGVKKFPIATWSSTSAAAYSQVSDIVNAAIFPSNKRNK